MKSIKLDEILKDANVKKHSPQSKIFEHHVASNGEEITVYTKNEKISLFLSSLNRKGAERFRIIKAIRDKAQKFGGSITIGEQGRDYIVSLAGNGELTIS